MNLHISLLVSLTLLFVPGVEAFAPGAGYAASRRSSMIQLNAETTEDAVTVDPKEAVKIFGRLAEKYIMLDSSGGMCCYSACTGK